MKVGIFTFHRAHNYGAMLQAYALQTACEKIGTKAYIVDYAPKYIDNQYKYFKLKKALKANALSFYNLFGNIKKQKGFENFKTNQFNIIDFKTKEKFDTLLYGSDQIWNPNINNGFDKNYFGYNGINTKRQVAYAASIGKSEFSDEEIKQFSNLAKNMDMISVREETAKNVLQPYYEKNIDVVLDPTLLISSYEWDKIAEKPKFKMPYILVYQVNIFPQTMQVAEELSKRTNIPIVEICYNKTKLKYNHKVLSDVSPREFVGLFKNAEYVVTSSFHGTAFSINYHRNFYTISHKVYGSRMNDLLFKLGISDRIVEALPNDIEKIDYTDVDKRLQKEKEHSLEFLEKAIMEK
jgi:hypothetical protein